MTEPTIKHYVEAVHQVFGVPEKNLRGPQRAQRYARARHALVHLLRQQRGLSYPMIGRFLGGRDHTTIIGAYKRAIVLIERDPEFREAVLRALSLVQRLADDRAPVEIALRRKVNKACDSMVAQIESARRDLLKTLED